jgi:hypothetical protein
MELEAPSPRIQPINSSVIFSKEADVVLTNDAWRVILEPNTSSISDALSIVREDLTITNEHKREFTAVSELKQIEALLNTAEARLSYFHQLLPKTDKKRGLFNLGGSVLKTLLGTATVADVRSLHTVEQLQERNNDIEHSLTGQVTYIRNLNQLGCVNTEAVANLSSAVKDFMIRSHDRFYEVTRDIMLLNLTTYNQSAIYMAVRQLEFSLLQLTQLIDSLLAAVQCVLHGKLPLSLIGPSILQGILRNVSFIYLRIMS